MTGIACPWQTFDDDYATENHGSTTDHATTACVPCPDGWTAHLTGGPAPFSPVKHHFQEGNNALNKTCTCEGGGGNSCKNGWCIIEFKDVDLSMLSEPYTLELKAMGELWDRSCGESVREIWINGDRVESDCMCYTKDELPNWSWCGNGNEKCQHDNDDNTKGSGGTRTPQQLQHEFWPGYSRFWPCKTNKGQPVGPYDVTEQLKKSPNLEVKFKLGSSVSWPGLYAFVGNAMLTYTGGGGATGGALTDSAATACLPCVAGPSLLHTTSSSILPVFSPLWLPTLRQADDVSSPSLFQRLVLRQI